jgi:Ras-related protein Rab-8A
LEKKIESLKILITNEFGKINETIQILSKQNKENIEKLNKNKNEIKLLKDELCNFKEFKSKNKIESNTNKNLDIKKKQNENNISTKLGIYSKVSIQEEAVYEVKKLNKEEKEDFSFNIIIEGAEKVGKSSIIEKFVEMKNPQEKEGISNFGYKILNKYVKIDNTIIKLEIIDFVVGDISKRSTNNYKNADLIMFIYSINDSKSFEKIIQKLWTIKPKSKQVYFLVGNKSELENRNVQQKEAKNAMTKFNISYFMEASAKTGNNIDTIFYEAVKILYKNKKVSNSHKANIIELSKGEELKKTNTALKYLFPA